MEWILHMICFEFKIAEANWLTLLWLLQGECGESARDFNVIVLQHVNSNYGLKTVTRISPSHFAYILPKCFDLLFLFVDCTGCRIQEITIMFWLVDVETTFSLCGKRFVLGARAFRLHMYRSGKMACPRSKKCRLSWAGVFCEGLFHIHRNIKKLNSHIPGHVFVTSLWI